MITCRGLSDELHRVTLNPLDISGTSLENTGILWYKVDALNRAYLILPE